EMKPLIAAIKGYQATATFFCGGSILIGTKADRELKTSKGPISAPPIIIRWSGSVPSDDHEIELPIRKDGQQDQFSNLTNLLNACEPATFGLGNKDVFD